MSKAIIRAIYVLFALLFTTAVPAAADNVPVPDQFLDLLQGRWDVIGTLNGHPTKHAFKAEWTFRNKYLRFRDVSEEEDANGIEEFEVIAYIGYDPANKRYVCAWIDNQGTADPESMAAATPRVGDTLPFVYKMKDGTLHSTLAYDAQTKRWTWSIDREKGGALQPVARLQLKHTR